MYQTHSVEQIEYHEYTINTGEYGKYLEYSMNTYKGTRAIIKGDNKFTKVIEDDIGAKKSAPDFKLYNIPLNKLIKD